MLIADIKGKLSLQELNSEDFLTSSVFSFFNYIPPVYLEMYINEAVNSIGEHLNLKIENPVISFWPWYSNTKEYGYGAEPDVVIFSDDKAILIEAKNYSGKSGVGVEVGSTENEMDLPRLYDQLAREYYVGLKKILGTYNTHHDKFIKYFYLVYLTRHTLIPRNDFEETVNSIKRISKEEDAKKRLYWLNWHKIVPILDRIIEREDIDNFLFRISNDLKTFLEKRDINIFKGFNNISGGIIENFKLSDNIKLFYTSAEKEYWVAFNDVCVDNKNILWYSDRVNSYFGDIKFEYISNKEFSFYKGR